MKYLEININCPSDYTEILMAELVDIGFDSFMETDQGISGYITESLFSESALQKLIKRYDLAEISYSVIPVIEKNWNEEWEKNYAPIIVDEKCIVKASFHQVNTQFPYEILINPRMSFGTGHHETTYLMLSFQMEIDHLAKKVADIGSGTGILAIMAHKLGARYIVAVDNNEWAVENSKTNIADNQADQVIIIPGTVKDLNKNPPFDLVLANINRNILLQEAAFYYEILDSPGQILISGFYQHDISALTEKFNSLGFSLLNQKTKNNWAALHFKK
ncbi:MAG: 50S ribosomal protein L11 methyltransferase [Candidatus Cyclobacteriaceae bacterium M3_2C_046]